MASIKKYNGSTFVDAAIRKYSTATEALTLPQTIYADGTAATVSLKGNTVQNGTPTPSNPIDVVGVGELETSGEHSGEYKIPISSGQTTTNVYLGSTNSTRQIKKYVCTGNETVRAYDATNSRIFVEVSGLSSMGIRLTPMMCSHFQGVYDGRPVADVPLNSVYSGSTIGDYGFYIKETDYQSDTALKAFLADQYANGTPVTIWYAISAAETAAVNEPLMKIGTYADTLSNATSIPTTDGANTITVDTTVQPSEFTATWTGWHDAEVKEYVASTNLIDCAIEDGGYNSNTGQKTTGNYYRTADYIKVNPSTKYRFGRNGTPEAAYVCEYKNDKTYIQRIYPKSIDYFTTSENTEYITIYRSNTSSNTKWQLNLGEDVLPYEAYFEPYWQ